MNFLNRAPRGEKAFEYARSEIQGHLLPRGLLDLSPCCSILYSRSHSLTDACCGGAQGSVLVRPAAPLYPMLYTPSSMHRGRAYIYSGVSFCYNLWGQE